MNINEERAARGRPPLASSKKVAEKWRRRAVTAAPKWAEAMAANDLERFKQQLLSTLTRIDYHLAENKNVGRALADKMDHIHRDVAAIRETLSIQRPECAPPAPRPARARRAPKPAAPPDAAPPLPQDERSKSEA